MSRRLLRSVARWVTIVVAAAAVFVAVDVVRYVVGHPGDSVQQNVASWARNNRLGWIVDELERRLHADPPSTDAADELGLVDSLSTVPGTTLPLVDGIPDDYTPVVSPALAGEGTWRPLESLRGEAAVWATSWRPSTRYPSVVATATAWDPRSLHIALHNGTEIPGRAKTGTWTNGPRVSKAARPSLVAAFNGGFRFEHGAGGYVTEGRTVSPMRDGYATLAVAADGHGVLGRWGSDIVDDGSWTSLRQNLPPLVAGSRVTVGDYSGVNWGEDYDDVVWTFRSALCRRTDGLFMYVAAGDVDIELFASILVDMGCDFAMQLDINGTWPQFATYSGFGTATRGGRLVDRRMGNRDRYLNKSTKDFFALYDPDTLPAGIVK